MFGLQPPRHISTLRILLVAVQSGEGPLSEPTAAAQIREREPLFMPHAATSGVWIRRMPEHTIAWLDSGAFLSPGPRLTLLCQATLVSNRKIINKLEDAETI